MWRGSKLVQYFWVGYPDVAVLKVDAGWFGFDVAVLKVGTAFSIVEHTMNLKSLLQK